MNLSDDDPESAYVYHAFVVMLDKYNQDLTYLEDMHRQFKSMR